MPVVPISNAGQHGIVVDIPAHELPPNAWSSGQNVHFVDGYAEKMSGQESLWGGASIAPYFLMPVRAISGDIYWVYAGTTAVWAYEVTGAAPETHTDITRASGAYTAAAVAGWQGGVLNGVPILNNGTDAPQMWLPVSETSNLADLTAWPASTTAKILRAYKNHLVALDVTKSGVRDGRLVKWSHPASAGAVPTSWDETDPTKDAGEYSLADTEGELKDCIPLRDVNVIYKDDSVWGMQLVGGADIFKFYNIFRNVGAVGKHCAVEYQTGRHLVLAKDDLFVHDGQQIEQVCRGRMRSWLFSTMDATYAARSFIVLDSANSEAWVCYPETGNAWPNRALVWNWLTGAFGFRELPNTPHIAAGLLNRGASADQWGAHSGSWASWSRAWGDANSNAVATRLLMASYADSKLLGVYPGAPDFDSTTETVLLERTGLGIPFKSGEAPDLSSMKFCTNVWPKITGTVGMVVQVQMGSQMGVTLDPTWGDWQDYTIGTTVKLDVRLSGRMFAIRFRSTAEGAWRLQGYDLDVQMIGSY